MLGFQKYWRNGLWESKGHGTDYGKIRDQVQFTGSYVTGNSVWEATRTVYGKLCERFTRSYRNGLREATGTVYSKLRQQFMGTVYRNGLRKRFTGSYKNGVRERSTESSRTGVWERFTGRYRHAERITPRDVYE